MPFGKFERTIGSLLAIDKDFFQIFIFKIGFVVIVVDPNDGFKKQLKEYEQELQQERNMNKNEIIES